MRKRKSRTSLNFYVYTQPFIYCLYYIYARKTYATVEIHPYPRVSCVLNPPHYTQFTREKRVNTRVKKYTQKVAPKSKILSDVFVRS